MPFDAMSAAARAEVATRPLRLLWLTEDPTDAGVMLALRAQGHAAIPFMPDAGGLLRPLAPPLRNHARALAFAWRQRAPIATMAAGCRVAHAALRSHCGHVHAASPGTAAAAVAGARLAGLTVSIAVTDPAPRYGRKALRATLAAADLVLAPSHEVAESLRRLCPRLHLRLVPQGVDAARLLPAPEAQGRNGRLLAAGPLVPAGGFDVLLSAMARLPPSRRPSLDIAGDGPLRHGLETRAQALGLGDAVRFLGARPETWLMRQGPAYLGLVLPMMAAGAEAAPHLAKSALAMGLPVIATAIAGLAEVVSPDVGYLIPPGNAAALAEALLWLGGMPEQRRRAIGGAGRDRAELVYSKTGEARGLAAAVAGLAPMATLRAW
ncbi:glycosyl transferase family 4 [Humitalea rosea]|uniref:Glycosyl transferase family 4 n=1 Tax=Humitalea rosea TaxID=990373 RepID=A0A2W7IWQ5_9PROT|nr:glycosyltransferase [Humitalea rosea]PZW50350.1 glycosyl transferase family 4 [Humitalea rosea]